MDPALDVEPQATGQPCVEDTKADPSAKCSLVSGPSDTSPTLLSLVEDLKNKLITEKKKELLLELKIREEVAQEFTRYFAEQEIKLKERLSREQKRIEEYSERFLEIFKELVDGSTKSAAEENKLKDRPRSERPGPLDEEQRVGPGTYTDLEGILDSLHNDAVDVKKQAEEACKHIVSLEDSNEATGWLEKQLGKISPELSKTKEEPTKKTNQLIKPEEKLTQKIKDFEMQMIKLDESAAQLKKPTEKMNTQNKRIQEVMDIVEQKEVIVRLQDLISRVDVTITDYESTETAIKRNTSEKNSNKKTTESCQPEENALEVCRKRCSGKNPTVEGKPPTEKGTISTITQTGGLPTKLSYCSGTEARRCET